MWRYITSFFGHSAPAAPTPREIDEIQRSLEAQQAEEDRESEEENDAQTVHSANFTSVTKRGTITEIDDGVYLIDHVYTYPVNQKADLKIGATVLYDLMKEQSRTVVTNVQTVNNEDWCFEDQNVDKERGWAKRTYLCQITHREGRILTANPSNINIDLNVVSAEFMPIVGDWVYIDLKVEIDENVTDLSGKILEIDKVRIVRIKIVEGVVNVWRSDNLTGVVNHEIYFDKTSLSLGYNPSKGDRVICQAIESTQGICAWRSLKLLARSSVKLNESIESALMKFNPGHSYQSTLPDINITDNLTVCSNSFNNPVTFYVTVANIRKIGVILKEVRNDSNNPQVSVSLNGCLVRNLEIKGGCNAVLEAKFRPCMIGNCREVLVFAFDEGEIGRDVDCTLTGVEQSKSMVGKPGRFHMQQSNFRMSTSYNVGGRDFIHGTKPKMPPRFLAGRVPMYPVPKQMQDYMETVMDERRTSAEISEGLKKLYRHLSDKSLVMENYELFLHTLLHLEDIENAVAMHRYDRDQVCFIQNGAYLMLEVENLFEQRPSVIVGDRVIAKDVFAKGDDGAKLEAYVHKVSANFLYLKFGPAVHERYNGEDYSITIVHNRGQFRKMHHAVYLAHKNLGEDFLFPSKVVEKEPQLPLTWTPYEDELKNMHDKMDRIERVNKAVENGHRNLEDLRISDSNGLKDSEIIDEVSFKTDDQLKSEENVLKLILFKEDKLNSSSPKESVKSEKMKSPSQIIMAQIRKEAEERKRKEQEALATSVEFEGEVKSKLILTDLRRNHLPRPSAANEARQYFLDWINKDLNYYQKEAVRNILLGQARPLPYFIFGPPGTGKTVTIIETVLQLTRLIPHSRLLVATPSNSAADLIALRLIDSGCIKPGDMIRFVANRIIQDDNIDPKLAPYCATGTYARDGTDVCAGPVVTPKGYTLGVSSLVIGRHQITVATCGALGSFYSMGFPRGHFTHVIIDEAGQATEPETMIPLVLMDSKTGQAILAGDPMQLGPVCISKQAKTFGLTDSFLERILERFPYSRDIEGFPHTCGFDPRLITRLIYNYRALPQMLELPNKMFYNSDLRATIRSVGSAEANLLLQIAEILPKGLGKHGLPPSFVFHGINSVNYQTEDSPSWFNPDEASQVFYYINELYRLRINSTNIGVISPYDKQVKQIRAILNEAEFELPKIGSVEEFQGQEFPIILLSTVRSSEEYIDADLKHTLGFLAHPRRLNVAITRGKSLTIIIGNPNLLSLDQHWRQVLKYCLESNAYIGCRINRSLIDVN